MLTDKQASPSDENIYLMQADHEILKVLRGHLFTIISPFTMNLREVLQMVAETPSSGENNFIRKTKSNFLIAVC
jgi:hypothetical protein